MKQDKTTQILNTLDAFVRGPVETVKFEAIPNEESAFKRVSFFGETVKRFRSNPISFTISLDQDAVASVSEVECELYIQEFFDECSDFGCDGDFVREVASKAGRDIASEIRAAVRGGAEIFLLENPVEQNLEWLREDHQAEVIYKRGGTLARSTPLNRRELAIKRCDQVSHLILVTTGAHVTTYESWGELEAGDIEAFNEITDAEKTAILTMLSRNDEWYDELFVYPALVLAHLHANNEAKSYKRVFDKINNHKMKIRDLCYLFDGLLAAIENDFEEKIPKLLNVFDKNGADKMRDAVRKIISAREELDE